MAKYFGNGQWGDAEGNIAFVRQLEQFEWFTEGDYYVWRNVDCGIPLEVIGEEWSSILFAKVNRTEDRKLEQENHLGEIEFWFQIF